MTDQLLADVPRAVELLTRVLAILEDPDQHTEESWRVAHEPNGVGDLVRSAVRALGASCPAPRAR